LMSWTQSLRRVGLRSTRTATTRKQAKVQRRQAVLQLEMRHLLLLEKELEQEQARIQHRLEELSPKPVLDRYQTLLPLQEAQKESAPDWLVRPPLISSPDNPAQSLLRRLEQGDLTLPPSSPSSP
jgi:hypothetical protein